MQLSRQWVSPRRGSRTFRSTGDALLPDVGRLEYNGGRFSSLYKSQVNGNVIQDEAQRTSYTVRLETKCETAVATIAFEPRGQVRPWFKTVAVAVADGENRLSRHGHVRT